MTKLTKSEKEKLKAEALAEYEKKILIPAWKEYLKIEGHAYAEYMKRCKEIDKM